MVLQKLLDAAAAAGGGTVQLKPGVYYTCRPLILGSNVHLRGAGRGATIIRGSAQISGRFVDNAYVGASIASVGTDNTSVTDLTIDHATCGRNANGLAFMPTGTSATNVEKYDGTVPTNGLVERVEVLGAPDFHNYMIWNLRGQHMKFADNWVDGGATTNAAQEGIESFGGYDVVINNNTVKNIGAACINLGSAGIVNSETNGLFVTNNYANNCGVGVNIGTSSGNGNQMNSHTHITGNIITEARTVGIDVAVAVATNERDLQISGNTIRNISGDSVAGIRLRASGGPIESSAVIATTVDGNHIDNIQGRNAFGIVVVSYPNARLVNNTIVDTANEGIYAIDSQDMEITSNRIERTGSIAIGMYPSPARTVERFSIERNKISDWSSVSPGVLVNRGRYGLVRDNVFSRKDHLLPSPVVVDSESCSVRISGNIVWYLPNWPGAATPNCQ